MQPDLGVQLGPLHLRNPVMPASGCFGYGREYSAFYDLSVLGAIVVKAVTKHERHGNPSPRVTEVSSGMLNSIGLANPGLKEVLETELPWAARFGVPIIVNVAGETIDEYCDVVEQLCTASPAAAVELNVSCPNVSSGGLAFGVEPAVLERLVSAVRAVCTLPLFVKLSPNVTDIRVMAETAEKAGADGLSLINTLLGAVVDVHTRKAVLGRGVGGLSGPAIKPVALRMVYEVCQTVTIPVIGMGGIYSGEDAAAFIMAGAAAVAVGTANFSEPTACARIIAELEDFCRQEQVASLDEIRGCLSW